MKKKTLFITIFFMLILFITPSIAASAGKQNNTVFQPLKLGDEGEQVLNAKKKLYKLGFIKKKPTDNIYQKQTEEAVRKFEEFYDLNIDGALSSVDLEFLYFIADKKPLKTPTITVKIKKSTSGKESINIVDISWKSIKGANSYDVYRSIDEGKSFKKYTRVTRTSFTDMDWAHINTDKKLMYKVKAISDNGNRSDFSKTKSVVVPKLGKKDSQSSEPDVLASINYVNWKNRNYGVIWVYLGFKNNSKKSSIDSVDVNVVLYDTYGSVIDSGVCTLDAKVVKPGKSYKSGSYYWLFSGNSKVKQAKVYIQRLHLTDGRVFTYTDKTATYWQ